MNIQLLCTFCKVYELDDFIYDITHKYEIFSNKIFILMDEEDDREYILTYNVKNMLDNDMLDSTISVHRKKQTNTIYTINALNELILEKNNGVLDKNFQVDWSEYQNTILVTAFGGLKVIHTKIHKILNV